MPRRSSDAARPAAPEFLVLGLGNPGDRYRGTRHNLGFRVADALARATGARFREGPGPSLVGAIRFGPSEGAVAKPLTWMNRSGVASRALVDGWGGPPLDRLLVVADDLDLPLGRIRFRPGGGDGGHNGLRSIIAELASRDFPRLRLGIGRPSADRPDDVIDHVLDPFLPEEAEAVEEVVERACRGVRVFVLEGILAAMNAFNAPGGGGGGPEGRSA